MPSKPSDRIAPVRRTRTPSDIKWLLTERAHLAGELRQLEQQRTFLANKLAYVSRQQKRLQALADKTEAELFAKAHALSALEHSLALLAPTVDPQAGGELKPKVNRFGKLGSLKAFLVKELQASYPEPRTTTELVDKALVHFDIEVYAPEVRRAARRTMLVLLQRMQRQGQLESLYATPPEYSGIWRWAEGVAPTLSDLATLQAGAAHDRDTGSPAHPA